MSQLTDNLSAIASIKSDIRAAIESKGVSMAGVSFGSYADKIGEIQTGGTFVTETLSVSNNGTYTPSQGVDGYSQVMVNVPQSVTGYDEKELTEGNYNIVILSNSATRVQPQLFLRNRYLESVYLPNCSEIGESWTTEYSHFYGCSRLTTVNLPICKNINNNAFNGCSMLSSISIPLCEYIWDYAFSGCGFTSIELPACVSLGTSAFACCSNLSSIVLSTCVSLGNSAFAFCSNLSYVDLYVCSKIGNGVFYSCINLTTAIFRSTSVCSTGTNCFRGTNSNLSIYVPSSLVDQYKSAKNWSSYSSIIFSIPE